MNKSTGPILAAEIGKRIREIRTKKLRMNQTDFAAVIGAPKQNYVSRYERGRIPGDLEVFIRIAQAGGVSLDWLLTGKNNVKNFKIQGVQKANAA